MDLNFEVLHTFRRGRHMKARSGGFAFLFRDGIGAVKDEMAFVLLCG